MAKDLLVRNLPDPLAEWIDAERSVHHMTQQEFVLSILLRVREDLRLKKDLFRLPPMPQPPVSGSIPFTFVDLFAGIGGFRIALQQIGGSCVFTSEWDKYCQRTYQAWFGDVPEGDIREISPDQIPNHTVMAAGFPCQPFSIAGVSKKKSLGRAHGFKDLTQGTLFFHLATLIEAKRPPIVFLENVKNLRSHDQGNTWAVIRRTLEDLDYWVFHSVIDASAWVPQHRERIYIICFDKKAFRSEPAFEFPTPPLAERPRLAQILDPDPSDKYTLSTHLWTYLQEYADRHRARGNGFGFGLADREGISRTLSARYYKDGSEILIPRNGGNPRRLTPTECARLMGFPETLPIVVSDTQAYKQYGNAVVPPVVQAIGSRLLPHIASLQKHPGPKPGRKKKAQP